MVPTALPAPDILVTLKGLFEIAVAVGLLLPQTVRAAAICSRFSSSHSSPNVRAIRYGFTILGRRAMSMALRCGMQVVFIIASGCRHAQFLAVARSTG